MSNFTCEQFFVGCRCLDEMPVAPIAAANQQKLESVRCPHLTPSFAGDEGSLGFLLLSTEELEVGLVSNARSNIVELIKQI